MWADDREHMEEGSGKKMDKSSHGEYKDKKHSKEYKDGKGHMKEGSGEKEMSTAKKPTTKGWKKAARTVKKDGDGCSQKRRQLIVARKLCQKPGNPSGFPGFSFAF